MASGEIHKSDVGTTIRGDIQDSGTAVDLSSSTFTSIFFVFLPPGGSANTQTATALDGSGTSGIAYYTVSSNTLFNTSGMWQVQAIVTVGSNTWYSDIKKFIVYENL